ncbi:hypothetical protein CQA48_30010, partial [Klebsiella pneumoniae]
SWRKGVVKLDLADQSPDDISKPRLMGTVRERAEFDEPPKESHGEQIITRPPGPRRLNNDPGGQLA